MLDPYARRARLAPALLAAAPGLAVIGASSLSPETVIQGLGVVAGAFAVAVCGVVRDRGKRLEPELWRSWGGSPTTRRLRWREGSDDETVRRLHDRLNAVLDQPLPDRQAESDDPVAADRRYEEAVAVLRDRTRDTRRFRLVYEENIEYGFRRNSLGLRPFAIAAAAVAVAISVILMFVGSGDAGARLTRWGVAAVISAGALFYWWLVVTQSWVRTPAEAYADRLLEAIETLRRS